jgi:hypothetical protein
MDAVAELGLRIISPVVVFALGAVTPRVRREIRNRRAKRFWRPFVRSDLAVVSDRHDFPEWEQSGLTSVAHARAIEELRGYFEALHLPAFTTVYSGEPSGDLLERSLVLLGGPDANAITRLAAPLLDTTFRFGDPERHEIGITDSQTGAIHTPRVPGGEIATDFGLLLKVRNPLASLDSRSELIILAGSFGYGTWAAARVSMSKDFLRDPRVAEGKPVECLVATDVSERNLHRVRIIEIRELEARPA